MPHSPEPQSPKPLWDPESSKQLRVACAKRGKISENKPQLELVRALPQDPKVIRDFTFFFFEMFFIRDLKPKLNKQSDSIRAKLFA